jgi:hypothetical protein
MAEVEHAAELHSTYYILLTSPYYNVFTEANVQRIKTIRELGMGIGLHYDPSILKTDNEGFMEDIVRQGKLLEHYVGELEGTSVTFHKPLMGTEVDEDLIAQLSELEIYCPNYDDRFKYISDSGHNWRENPYDTVEEFSMVHLNTHPIWYSYAGAEMEESFYALGLDLDADKLVQREINSIREYRENLNGPQM